MASHRLLIVVVRSHPIEWHLVDGDSMMEGWRIGFSFETEIKEKKSRKPKNQRRRRGVKFRPDLV